MEILPEWYGRQLLADALAAVGLPWVPWAVWRKPRDAMTYDERLQAVAVARGVLAEARRRLPPGVSGAVLDRGWRDAAWRCTVAGLALLDADAREQLAADDALEAHADRRTTASVAEPVVIRRRPAGPTRERSTGPAAVLTIRRRGEVARAS